MIDIRMKDIFIIGLIIAVTIILIRVIIGTPMIRRVMESFTTQSLTNITTECPGGAKMYMYGGAAYCCSSRINSDANSLATSCAAPLQRNGGELTFCSLGPSKEGVKNCYDIPDIDRGCPPDKPNYIKGPPGTATAAGRCCAGGVDSATQNCVDPASSCDFATNGNVFTTRSNPSCQFLRAQADDGTCPSGYNKMVFDITRGEYQGLSIYACYDMMKRDACIARGTVKRLKELGYDTSQIAVCPVPPT